MFEANEALVKDYLDIENQITLANNLLAKIRQEIKEESSRVDKNKDKYSFISASLDKATQEIENKKVESAKISKEILLLTERLESIKSSYASESGVIKKETEVRLKKIQELDNKIQSLLVEVDNLNKSKSVLEKEIQTKLLEKNKLDEETKILHRNLGILYERMAEAESAFKSKEQEIKERDESIGRRELAVFEKEKELLLKTDIIEALYQETKNNYKDGICK